MADSSDIEKSLVSFVAGALQFTGYNSGDAMQSPVNGKSFRVYRGWPTRAQLDQDLVAQVSHIHIAARPHGTNTTRYPRDWKILIPHVHTITATIDPVHPVVTLGGVVSVPQNVALVVNGVGYVYSTQQGDTLTTVAASLAALVSGAISLGPSITLPTSTTELIARVGGVATAFQEVKRQEDTFQLCLVCPDPITRDITAKTLDVALAAVQWLPLDDGTTARMRYVNTLVDDDTSKAGVFRRDLFYTVEYPTYNLIPAPEVVLAQSRYQTGFDLSLITPSNPPPIIIEA